MLVSLTPDSQSGVNFINILRAAFFVHNCYAKLFCSYNLCLHFFWQKEDGSKAAHKMLAKLTVGVNFINILCANFLCKCVFRSFSVSAVSVCIFLANGNLHVKCL